MSIAVLNHEDRFSAGYEVTDLRFRVDVWGVEVVNEEVVSGS